jgi:hypothetical protein
VKHARTAGHRPTLAVFGVSFVLVVISAYLQLVGNTKSQLKFVWASIAVSAVALVAAAVSVLLSRR